MMEKIKNSKKLSLIVVLAVYVIAGIVGVLVYNAVQLDYWLKLLIADVISTVIVFSFSLIFSNASMYDPYWSVQPAFILTLFVINNGINPVNAFLLANIWFWAIRLTSNWFITFKGLCSEDWRYVMLREKSGKFYPFVNFFGIHMVPTLIVYACVLPSVATTMYEVEYNFGSVIFFLVSIAAVYLQMISDAQLHVFRANNHGKLIRTGLWKYSRHPNYLGEILMWWGVALQCVCVLPGKWYFWIIGALSNTILFLFASIPMADKKLEGREGYDEYMKSTRRLLPIKK